METLFFVCFFVFFCGSLFNCCLFVSLCLSLVVCLFVSVFFLSFFLCFFLCFALSSLFHSFCHLSTCVKFVYRVVIVSVMDVFDRYGSVATVTSSGGGDHYHRHPARLLRPGY